MRLSTRGFSLVEVVVALGIASFAIVGLMGLFTVGYQSSKESEENIEAANLASLLIAQRRAAPTSNNFVIPPLFPAPPDGWIYLKADGTKADAADEARTRLTYHIDSDGISSNVYLMLSWPPQAEPANAIGRYELFTKIALP